MFGNFQKRVDNWFGRLKINAGNGTQAALTVNQDAGATGNLLDLKRDNVSRVSVSSSGSVILPLTGNYDDYQIAFGANNITKCGIWSKPGGIFLFQEYQGVGFKNNMVMASHPYGIGWGNAYSPVDATGFSVAIFRDGDGILAQRNDTAAQTSRLYSTYTSATNYHRMALTCAKRTLSAVSGATVATTGGLIPAGAFLMGVTTRVNTALGETNGTTGYSVGNGTDANLWGDVTAVAAGTASKASAIASQSSGYTASDACGLYLTAQDVTLTATGGNFDATGAIEISAFYFLAEAD